MKNTFLKREPVGPELSADSTKGIAQPPLWKPYTDEIISLPPPETAPIDNGQYHMLLSQRRSRRSFSAAPMTLAQLSFLLWSAQGILKVSPTGMYTLRPVPSACTRHPFETYIAALNVEGLKSGIYRYLPMEGALVYLYTPDAMAEQVLFTLTTELNSPKWVTKAGAVIYLSVVPYRAEWMSGPASHRAILLDAGHVMQNIYLSSEALGLGTCAIATYKQQELDALLRLDGETEFVIYLSPVGTLSGKKNA